MFASAVPELVRVLGLEGRVDDTGLDDFERLLSVRLPDDFREYVRRVPPGVYFGWFLIEHPRRFDSPSGVVSKIQDFARHWQRIKDREQPDLPWNFYPANGGLLPFGDVEDEFVVCWDTSGGQPNLWPIVVCNDELTIVERFETNMSGFLLNLLSGSVSLFGEALDFSEPPFRPAARAA